MAMLFASRTDQKEALYLNNTSLPPYQPVANRTRRSHVIPRSSAETQVEGGYGLTLPPNTQCFRHDQAWRWPYSQSKSPLDKQPSLLRSSEVDCYLEPGSHSDFDPSTPPPPSDLEALRKIWEQVRIYNTKIPKVSTQTTSSTSMTGTLSTIGEDEVLHPRGGRIEFEISNADEIWDVLHLKMTRLNEDSGAQDQLQLQLQRAGIWLFPETPDEGLEIEGVIKDLQENTPTVEAEWSRKLWTEYFFKVYPGDRHILQQWFERRQLHTMIRKDSPLQSNSDNRASTLETKSKPPENRYPPIRKQSRLSVNISETPYDVDPNRERNGYAFSDISYTIKIDKDISQDDLDLARLLPTLRLYKDLIHYMEDFKIEVKPLEMERWSAGRLYEYSVRYLTLTGMTMLHEWLKLCYMSSDDPEFFPRPEYFVIHLISAVGHTARHYIHRIRPGKSGESVKYVSSCVRTFDLKDAKERNNLRVRLNEIHILHVTAFKETMQNIVRKILALGKPEIQRRLNERTHKDMQFSIAERSDVWGFSVKHGSPIDQMESLPERALPFRTSNKDDGLTPMTSASQVPALAKFTKDNRPRCQALLKPKKPKQCKNTARKVEQCTNTARNDKLSCGIPLHQELVKNQLGHTP